MKPPDALRLRHSEGTIAWLAIVFVVATSLLALVGWVFDITLFKSIEPKWIEMRVVTALCLGISAAALALIHRSHPSRRRRVTATVLGSTVGLVGLLTAWVYEFRLLQGDESPLTRGFVLHLFLAPEHRMAMWTAGIFLMTGCILALLAHGGRRATTAAHALALPTALASYLIPVSYLLGVEGVHRLLNISVAMNTGIAFCALNVAIFCLRPDSWLMRVFTEDHAGGVMARRLFPALLMIPVVVGWLRLYGERQAIFGSEEGVVLVAMTYTGCLLAFLWLSARSVSRADKQRLAGEIALKASERRFATTLASLGDAVIAADADRRITLLNREAAELTGWSEEDAVGRSTPEVFRILDERTHQPAEDIVERVLREGRVIQLANHTALARRDGREVPIEDSAAPILDDAGRVTGVVLVFRDVTLKRQAQAALLESEQRFATTLASIGDAVIATDAEGRITFMNRVAETLTGWRMPEVEEMSVGDVFRVLDAATHEPQESPAEKALRVGAVVGLANHSVLLRRDGVEVPIDDSGAPIRDREGRITGAVVIFRDITERMRAEIALRESEARFRALTEALPQIVWTAGPEGRIEWLNQQWFEYTGQASEVGREPGRQGVIHPDDLPSTTASWERARQRGEVYENEQRLRRNDGEYRWFLSRAWPLGDSAGKVVRWVGTDTDIQDMKLAVEVLHRSRAELEALVQDRTASLAKVNRDLIRTLEDLRATQDAVAAERRRLHDVLEMLPVYVALLTPDHHMPFANRFFRDRFGDAGGRRCFEFLFERTEPCEKCETFTVLKTLKPHGWDWTGPDGRSYEVADFPFRGADGSTLIMEVGVDVTERRRVEEELRAVNVTLEQRAAQLRALTTELAQAEDRERRRLAEILHGHLQQLLVAARLSADSLRRTAEADSQLANATQMLELLDQAIAASRSLTMELSPPVLHEAGLSAGLSWLARWMESKHDFKVEVVAAAPEEDLTEDQRLLFFQAVRELLFNAVKHSGVRSARVVLDGESPDEMRVTVSDEGVGFDVAAHEAEAAPGGFGLFNIRERLAYVDGRMTIESAPGRGTKVTLTAPVRRASKREPVVPESLTAPPTVTAIPSGGGRSIRILVADDHAVVRQGLVQMLGRETGLEVVGEAVDGYDAVEKTRGLHPEVVLIDLTMPRMDGLEATKLITSESPDVRVIGLSMRLGEDVARRMMEAGAVRYLSKDTPIEEITTAIREACRKLGAD